jgi:hypothetical protein
VGSNGEIDMGWDLGGFRAAKKLSPGASKFFGRPLAKKRLEILGHIEILESDPKDFNSYCDWRIIGEQAVHQREWENRSK